MAAAEPGQVDTTAIPDVDGAVAHLAIDHVSKSYNVPNGELKALDDVSLDIKPGELTSVVGASGCGKSTLLSIIAGLTQATSGEVRIDGQKVTKPNPESVAVVFQEDALLPWYRIEENVALGLQARGMSRQDYTERVAQSLERVGLQDFGRAYPRELSGGMRQRAALARGLVQEPKVLLLDEPFAALDEQNRNLMGQELRALHERVGGTMVMITHSLTEAVLLSDQVVALSSRPGRVRMTLEIPLPMQRPVELIDTPEFAELRHSLWSELQEDWRHDAGVSKRSE